MYVVTVPERYGQTDGQTDRQTDRRHAISSPRSALASRGKNVTKYMCWFSNITEVLFISLFPKKLFSQELIEATYYQWYWLIFNC